MPEASLANAPASEYDEPSSTEAGLAPLTVTIGAVVSTTLTVRDAVPILPQSSIATYEIV